MSKSKGKSSKKAAPKSGLIMKNTLGSGTHAKSGSAGINKNFSSSKKGGSMNNLPRKAS